jgi:hypothetical protein
MSNQSVSLVEFTKLYNILDEIKYLFKFNINNYENSKDFFYEIESHNIDCINSMIIINKKNEELFIKNNIQKNNLLLIEEPPFKISNFLDIVNTRLITQKYELQSQIKIKDYFLNLNSRIISNKQIELKLTEKEINVILFLNDQKVPRSIVDLQNQVWGYSFELETHTVETHIYRLRKKIKDNFNDENFITSQDNGYKI